MPNASPLGDDHTAADITSCSSRRLRSLAAHLHGAHHSACAAACSSLSTTAVAGLAAAPPASNELKITAVKPYPTPKGFPGRAMLFVKVECEAADGTRYYGWGESGLSGRELATQGAVQHYAQFLCGCDAMQTGALWQQMYRSQYFEGGRTLTAAISAIDIALHDIKGKRLGVPVYQLLGGAHRHHVPSMCTVQGAATATIEDAVEQVQARVAEGWQCIRVNHAVEAAWPAGGPDPPGGRLVAGQYEPRISLTSAVATLTAVRAAVGNGPVLGTDFHHQYTPAEVASAMQKMPPGTLDWLEEGIRDESPEACECAD
jgi:galactonate dehydratase